MNSAANTSARISQSSSPLPIVNVLLVGDGGCGKSTFFSRLSLGQHQTYRQASPSPSPSPSLASGTDIIIQSQKQAQDDNLVSIESSTIEVAVAASPVLPELSHSDQPYIYTVHLGYRRFQLAFYDTSYPAQHWSLLNPDVVILAYDVTSRNGLNRLKEWRKLITRNFQLRRVDQDGNDALDVENGSVEVDREKIQIMLLGLKRDLRREEPGVIYPQEAYRIAQDIHCDAYAECSAVTGELIPQVFEDIVRLAVLSKTGKKNEHGGCFIL